MAEPITIISALATIIGVTITTSIQLTNLFSSIRDAPKEILGLYLELQSIQSVILDIQRSFESGGVSDSVPNEWIEDLDLTLRGCADVLAELTTLINKLKSNMQTGWYKRTWKGVKWTFLERDVKVLTTRLESFKSTLGLKMQALST
ncbi:hypothetical protein P167DRAFT_73672 [Morchella conica CCBAS932]|uniref:Azaphilone pigments biosynthesis cluster protein L N-terminal domain-containing protein n=2 Tax=Morchella sect. Distantes TaxID=1051054 RepID=A0A3N4KX76_9PEZI|nr:hypothetical protein P167DRAFT_73672 [Morchella conica CCBAS932]